MTAKETYIKNGKKVQRTLTSVQRKLKKMDKEFEKESGNWGYVGNQGHVLELLEQINNFLGQ